jgi:xylulokinase
MSPTPQAPVLAIDVGTSMVKVGLARPARGQLTAVRRSIPAAVQRHPHHEVDPGNWLRAIAECVAELQPRELAAVVVTGNGPSVVPADADGQPIGNAITWLDQRASAQSDQIARQGGRRREATFFLAKVLWYLQEEPQLFGAVRAFVSAPEFVELQLTGHWHTALAAPGFQRFYWDDRLLEAAGIDPGKLPPFVATGERVGEVTDLAAQRLGIPAGVPVYAGSTDFVMALVGSGTLYAGASLDRAGSSDGLNHCSSEPGSDERLITLPHIVPGLHTISGLVSTTGKALDWYLAATGGDTEIYHFAEIAAPGAGGTIFLPYLAGERTPLWSPDVRGAFFGLGLATGRAQMARAVMESIGFALRDSMLLMEESGHLVGEIRVTGGHPLVPGLNQLKADILGRRLVPVSPDAGLVGCACLAYVQNGTFPDLPTAAEALLKTGVAVEPNGQLADVYAAQYAAYQRARESVTTW